MHFKLALFVCSLTYGVYEVLSQTYGGGACNIPTAAPGATEGCGGTTNGFCALDTLATGPIAATGKCICYQTSTITYSGSTCTMSVARMITATPVSSTTSSTSSTTNAVGALLVGGLAAYFLSQLGNLGLRGGAGAGAGYGATPSLYGPEQYYVRQALG